MAKPKIRFKGYTDDWEQRKFSEFVKNVAVRNKAGVELECYAVTNDRGFISQKEAHDAFGYMADADTTAYNIVPPSSFAYNPARINVGSIGYYTGIENVIVSSLYEVFQTADYVDDRFMWHWFKSDHFSKWIERLQEGSVRLYFYYDKLIQCEMKMPSLEEQKKMGAFFDQLDHLITLHQRKNIYFYEKVTLVWEQRKLGDVLVSLQNNTLSRADLSNEAGVAKNVHYGDVLIKFGEVLDVSKEQLPMISDESILTKYKTSFLQNGDVIIADTAEDTTVGKCSEIVGLNDEVVLSGLHTIPYRPVEKFAPKYLGYYLNSDAYHNQLLPLMQGIKVTSISKSAMQDTDIIYPKSKEEQTEIGNYFDALDHLITLHQCKCHLLHKLLHNDWEQRKLGEVLDDMYNGQTPSRKRDEYWNGNIRWLSSGELNRGIVYSSIETITEEGKKSANLRVVPKGTFVMAITGLEASGTRGNCALLGFDTTLNQSCMALFPKQDILISQFLFQWYRMVGEEYGINYTQGTKQQSYNAELIKILPILLPSIDEQKKIASYLNSIDHLITLHHRKYIYILKSP